MAPKANFWQDFRVEFKHAILEFMSEPANKGHSDKIQSIISSLGCGRTATDHLNEEDLEVDGLEGNGGVGDWDFGAVDQGAGDAVADAESAGAVPHRDTD